ncbi:MAG: RNA polymerase Rpb4 family protein [Euryarchaeota archaeon]|nr:RNA polymerase Rpb4 family protein [Euryarchaeota archaeon]
MIVKQVLSEEPLTLAEVKELLNARHEADEELKYEKRRAIEHANRFAKTPAPNSRAVVEELKGLPKMKADIAIRIADLMPRNRDEVRAIYAKERFTLSEAEMDNILETVKKHR